MLATQEIVDLYRKFRKHSPFMLVGENARLALESAKTLARWKELEENGFVKIEKEFDDDPDPSFYDTWEHLSERTREKYKQEYCEDCWGVFVSFAPEACPHCGRCDDWEQADSIWGCACYDDPCDPFENCYVIGMMREAIEQFDKSRV